MIHFAVLHGTYHSKLPTISVNISVKLFPSKKAYERLPQHWSPKLSWMPKSVAIIQIIVCLLRLSTEIIITVIVGWRKAFLIY